jgi:hypothetical protein
MSGISSATITRTSTYANAARSLVRSDTLRPRRQPRSGSRRREPGDPIGLLAASGQHDDRDAGPSAKLAADVEARAVGEHHVQEHEVRLDVVGEGQRLTQ